jgi:hypothetical protein
MKIGLILISNNPILLEAMSCQLSLLDFEGHEIITGVVCQHPVHEHDSYLDRFDRVVFDKPADGLIPFLR